jgi:molybdopterin converting factor small subunit
MVVSVQFCGAQRRITRTHEIKVPLSETGQVRDVLDQIKRAYPGLFSDERAIMVSVNNKISTPERFLAADDKIVLLPHIGGG